MSLPDPALVGEWQLSAGEVMEAIRSFPAGLAWGPDGFGPGNLLGPVEPIGTGSYLIDVPIEFINLLLRCEC